MKIAKEGDKRGPESHDADVWASPEFKALSAGLGKVLSIPKETVDAIVANEKAAREVEKGTAK